MTLDDQLTALMYAASDEAPPPRVDLGRAVRDGRRRRRVRVLGSSAAVVVLALLAGVTLVATRPHEAPELTPATPAPTTFDPMVLRIETGWNPDNLHERAPRTSTLQQVIAYGDETGIHKQFDLTVYAAGQLPWQLSGMMPKEIGTPSIVEAAPVHGRPAKRFVFASGAGSSSGLAWQWADGAWAVARATRGYGGTQEVVERLLADNLRTNVSRPVRLPFRVTAPLPDGVRLFLTSGQGQGSDPYGAQAEMGFSSPSVQAVLVDLFVAPATSGRRPQPNTTLGGHPAYLSWQNYGDLVIYDLDGFDVQLTMPPEAGLLTQDQAVALALSVRRV